MKLLRAKFQNFRLLRDLELEFSSDPDKHLTVIRAANESGKTTILLGLQWALYGDDALPDKGEDFRLYPIDWNASEGVRVPITASVDFEVATYQHESDNTDETHQRYRLIRSTFEEVDSQTRRPASTVKLFELNETGAKPVNYPEVRINEELPPELREVFFTDGDRALSFIEADVTRSTKRERVEKAIYSLLGLGVIERAIKHVGKSEASVNKQMKQDVSDSELDRISTRLETIENDMEILKDDLKDAKLQFGNFDEKVVEIDRKIATALQGGGKEKLRESLDQTKNDIKGLNDQLAAVNKEHADLFRSRSIATDLLAPLLSRASEKLETLHNQGRIPTTTIPVLQDRLSAKICICGETLALGDVSGERRRMHIQKLIEDNQKADEIQEIITSLYFSPEQLRDSNDVESSAWLDDNKQVAKRRRSLSTQRKEAGNKFRALELQLDSLPDTDIQGLRDTRRQYMSQRDRHLSNQVTAETKLTQLRREREEEEGKRDRLLRDQEKGARIRAELAVIQDVTKVLNGAYQRIKNEELKKVSDSMNRIFLEMIGADPEQGATIKHAEINLDNDIVVYGPQNRMLNPDRDLNGASRRALTLAFILALTRVSEVEAPNIIDTPLGMTSGFVKRSILRTAVRESSQLVLLLTHDEIAECKDIIDDMAGVVFTLTNPAHYPKMLVNDPGVPEGKILRCECNHRRECQLCQRHVDAVVELD